MHECSPACEPLLQNVIATEVDIAVAALSREEGISVSRATQDRWETYVMHRVCSALQHSLQGHESPSLVIDHAVAHALTALITPLRERDRRARAARHCRLLAALRAFWSALLDPPCCRP